jgi:hypothetical protein
MQRQLTLFIEPFLVLPLGEHDRMFTVQTASMSTAVTLNGGCFMHKAITMLRNCDKE